MVFVLLTFLVFFAAIMGAYQVFVVSAEEEASGAVLRRLKGSRRARHAIKTQLERQEKKLSAVAPLEALLRHGKERTHSLQLLMEQSGTKSSMGAIVLASAVLALVGFCAVQILSGWSLSIWLILTGLVVAAALAMVPTAVLRFKRARRLRKFEEQFPEALDLLARAIRAGHALTTALEMVADELPEPAGPEFRLLYDQQNFGLPMAEALKGFAERIPLVDARFFVTAVLIQRESGGNLSEVLDNLSTVIRDRFKVKRQIRVISAHGRITGWVLVSVPPVLFLVLVVINEEYRTTMFGTVLGIQLLVGALILQIVGALIIRKIINIEY